MKVQPHTISSEGRNQLILFTLKPALNLSAGLQSQTSGLHSLPQPSRSLWVGDLFMYDDCGKLCSISPRLGRDAGVAEGLISAEVEGGSTYCPSLSVRRELTFHEYKMAAVKTSGSRGDLGNNYGGRRATSFDCKESNYWRYRRPGGSERLKYLWDVSTPWKSAASLPPLVRRPFPTLHGGVSARHTCINMARPTSWRGIYIDYTLTLSTILWSCTNVPQV